MYRIGKANLKLGLIQKPKLTISNKKIKTTGSATAASKGKFQLTNHFTSNSAYRKKSPKRLGKSEIIIIASK